MDVDVAAAAAGDDDDAALTSSEQAVVLAVRAVKKAVRRKTPSPPTSAGAAAASRRRISSPSQGGRNDSMEMEVRGARHPSAPRSAAATLPSTSMTAGQQEWIETPALQQSMEQLAAANNNTFLRGRSTTTSTSRRGQGGSKKTKPLHSGTAAAAVWTPRRGSSSTERPATDPASLLYRYPVPPPVTDQLYVPEQAVVRLCGLPNLTLTSRTHYAASPFLYTAGASPEVAELLGDASSGSAAGAGSPAHHFLCYPTHGPGHQTNTAAGRFQEVAAALAPYYQTESSSPNNNNTASNNATITSSSSSAATKLVLLSKDVPIPESAHSQRATRVFNDCFGGGRQGGGGGVAAAESGNLKEAEGAKTTPGEGALEENTGTAYLAAAAPLPRIGANKEPPPSPQQQQEQEEEEAPARQAKEENEGEEEGEEGGETSHVDKPPRVSAIECTRVSDEDEGETAADAASSTTSSASTDENGVVVTIPGSDVYTPESQEPPPQQHPSLKEAEGDEERKNKAKKEEAEAEVLPSPSPPSSARPGTAGEALQRYADALRRHRLVHSSDGSTSGTLPKQAGSAGGFPTFPPSVRLGSGGTGTGTGGGGGAFRLHQLSSSYNRSYNYSSGSDGGNEEEGWSCGPVVVEDPRETSPISKQLKWRFLTAAAIGVAGSGSGGILNKKSEEEEEEDRGGKRRGGRTAGTQQRYGKKRSRTQTRGSSSDVKPQQRQPQRSSSPLRLPAVPTSGSGGGSVSAERFLSVAAEKEGKEERGEEAARKDGRVSGGFLLSSGGGPSSQSQPDTAAAVIPPARSLLLIHDTATAGPSGGVGAVSTHTATSSAAAATAFGRGGGIRRPPPPHPSSPPEEPHTARGAHQPQEGAEEEREGTVMNRISSSAQPSISPIPDSPMDTPRGTTTEAEAEVTPSPPVGFPPAPSQRLGPGVLGEKPWKMVKGGDGEEEEEEEGSGIADASHRHSNKRVGSSRSAGDDKEEEVGGDNSADVNVRRGQLHTPNVLYISSASPAPLVGSGTVCSLASDSILSPNAIPATREGTQLTNSEHRSSELSSDPNLSHQQQQAGSGNVTEELHKIPITAHHTATPSPFAVKPAIPRPQELPQHLVVALEQAHRTMTLEGNLCPRPPPVCPSSLAQSVGSRRPHTTSTAPSSAQRQRRRLAKKQGGAPAAAAATFDTSTFSLTMPKNQFNSATERHLRVPQSRRDGGGGPPLCGHVLRRQMREAQIDARLESLREALHSPIFADDDDDGDEEECSEGSSRSGGAASHITLPPQDPSELHVTRTMHQTSSGLIYQMVNTANAGYHTSNEREEEVVVKEEEEAMVVAPPVPQPSEKEVQFLWKESYIRPMPLIVGQSPMEHIAAPAPNKMLLQHSQASKPPYAAAEAAELACQRRDMSRMEYEEKMKPFRIAKTLLTNTNARHLELLAEAEKRKARDQWLIQRVGAYFPENEEAEDEDEDEHNNMSTPPLPSGGGTRPTTPSGEAGGAAAEGNEDGGAPPPVVAPPKPFRIPKNFPPAFRALVEEWRSTGTAAASPSPSHRRHGRKTHGGRVRSAGDGASRSSFSPSKRPQSPATVSMSPSGSRFPATVSTRSQQQSKSYFSHRHGHGGGFDGPTLIHHPHLDRLREALLAPDNEVDALLQPPGWPKHGQDGVFGSFVGSPGSIRSSAFDQYRRSMQPSPAASTQGGDSESQAPVNPDKKRLDEISALFLRLLEEAADTVNYESMEERERIIDIHAAFQEQRLQQEYQNHHPLLDVAVSLSFDEQWPIEVARHKSEKDRKDETIAMQAAAAEKKLTQNAKHNEGGGKGSDTSGKKKAGGGKPSRATSAVASTAVSRRASRMPTSSKMGSEMPSTTTSDPEGLQKRERPNRDNPLFPMARAWSRENERVRQHEGLLDLLRHRPISDFPGLISPSGTFTVSAVASMETTEGASSGWWGTGASASNEDAQQQQQPAQEGEEEAPAAAVVSSTTPHDRRSSQSEVSSVASHRTSDETSAHPHSRSSVVATTTRSTARRSSSCVIDESKNIILEDDNDGEAEKASVGPEDTRRTSSKKDLPSLLVPSGSGQEEAGSPTATTTNNNATTTTTTTTAEGGSSEEWDGALPHRPPPLVSLAPSVLMPAAEAAAAEAAKSQGPSVAGHTPEWGGSQPGMVAATEEEEEGIFDPWGSVREMGAAVPLGFHEPHMRVLLQQHDNAVAEMALLMEAEENSVTNLLQQM